MYKTALIFDSIHVIYI